MSAESNPPINEVDTPTGEASEAATTPDPEEAIAEQSSETERPPTPEEMDRFECLACGYTYEPRKGDDRSSIPVGIPFEEVPLNWRCPVCGAQKKRFANIGPAGTPSGFKENLNYGLGVNVLTPGQKSLLIFGGLIIAFFFFLSLYGLR